MASIHVGSLGDGPRSQLGWLLNKRAASLGLNRESIELLVRSAEFTRVSTGQAVCNTVRPTKFVRFPMEGVLKIVTYPDNRDPLVVRYLAPGQFVCVPHLPAHCGYGVAVVAHEPGLVALLGYRDVGRAMEALREKVAILASKNFRTVSRWLYEKSVLLRCSVIERLIHELAVLARDLPAAGGDRTRIAPHLFHEDLAALVGATRSCVTREMGKLGDVGLIWQPSKGMIVVSEVLLEFNPADVAACFAPFWKVCA